MIQRNATDPSHLARRWTFTRNARTAWELLLRGRTWPSGSSLLMPGYIGYTEREGSGVFDPVENTGTPCTFYPVGPTLEVDTAMIERRLATGRHPMLLVVHWFGLSHADMPALRKLCDLHGTMLVEDCAHVPGPAHGNPGLGTYGHAAFHSLHKVLAVETGGCLVLNDPALAHAASAPDEHCALPVVEQFARTDMKAVADARRSSYAWLADRLRSTPGIELLRAAPGDEVPHDFPLLVKDGLRERLYFALMDRGLPTIALYYRMIDQITPAEHPNSHAIAQSILNLPVHQDTTREDLALLCDALEEELGALRL